MKCPADDTVLAIAERHGVEIDYCPQCRGVWLDRGELDKLLDRVAEQAPDAPRRDRDDRDDRPRDRDDRPYDRGDRPRPADSHGRRKRKSFLGEFFEFGD